MEAVKLHTFVVRVDAEVYILSQEAIEKCIDGLWFHNVGHDPEPTRKEQADYFMRCARQHGDKLGDCR